MKSIITAAVAIGGLAISAPSMAQTTGYGTLGYNHLETENATLGEVQGRLGLRFGRYIGVEGELAQGVKADDITIGGASAEVKARPSAAAYAVGYMPIGERADLFARVGYGSSRYRAESGGVGVYDVDTNINYGVGGQYFFTGNDGMRLDYTRKTLNGNDTDVDSVGLSYVRKF